jgi:hypothetical protein
MEMRMGRGLVLVIVTKNYFFAGARVEKEGAVG